MDAQRDQCQHWSFRRNWRNTNINTSTPKTRQQDKQTGTHGQPKQHKATSTHGEPKQHNATPNENKQAEQAEKTHTGGFMSNAMREAKGPAPCIAEAPLSAGSKLPLVFSIPHAAQYSNAASYIPTRTQQLKDPHHRCPCASAHDHRRMQR